MQVILGSKGMRTFISSWWEMRLALEMLSGLYGCLHFSFNHNGLRIPIIQIQAFTAFQGWDDPLQPQLSTCDSPNIRILFWDGKDTQLDSNFAHMRMTMFILLKCIAPTRSLINWRGLKGVLILQRERDRFVAALVAGSLVAAYPCGRLGHLQHIGRHHVGLTQNIDPLWIDRAIIGNPPPIWRLTQSSTARFPTLDAKARGRAEGNLGLQS